MVDVYYAITLDNCNRLSYNWNLKYSFAEVPVHLRFLLCRSFHRDLPVRLCVRKFI